MMCSLETIPMRIRVRRNNDGILEFAGRFGFDDSGNAVVIKTAIQLSLTDADDDVTQGHYSINYLSDEEVETVVRDMTSFAQMYRTLYGTPTKKVSGGRGYP